MEGVLAWSGVAFFSRAPPTNQTRTVKPGGGRRRGGDEEEACVL